MNLMERPFKGTEESPFTSFLLKICFTEYVDGEGDDEDDIVSKLYGNAQRELMMER